MTDRCLWTGQPLRPDRKGGSQRKFANDSARAAAHRAARKYTLALIESGELTWERLREWDQGGQPAPYTRPGEGKGEADGG